jgi:transmembrane sensor
MAAMWCLRLSEGRLPPADRLRFEAWLAESLENRRAFEDSLGIWRAVGEDSLSPSLMTFRREALSSFENASRSDGRRSWPRHAMWLASSVASLMLALAVAWFWSSRMPIVYATSVGEKRVVMLNDGSKVSLDAATEVRVRYSERARELQLVTGRAKFDVAHNPRRPFTVAAAGKVVHATGTAFSVELLQGQVRVVLYEGHVAVLEQQPDGPLEPLRRQVSTVRSLPQTSEIALDAGEELVVSDAAPVARVAKVDALRSLAWEDGQISLEREPLATAVERMNRYSTEHLSVADAEAAALLVDGVFEAGDTEAFVAGVTGVFPIDAHRTSTGISLSIRH